METIALPNRQSIKKEVEEFLNDSSKSDYQKEYPFPENRFSVFISINKYNGNVERTFIYGSASVKLYSNDLVINSFLNFRVENADEFMFFMDKSSILGKIKNPDLIHG